MSSREKQLPHDLALALTASRRWYESGGKDGQRLFLAYESYENIDFSGELFTEATLQEANLGRSCLEAVNAVSALANGIHLNNSILHFSNWMKAEMEGADFSGAAGKQVKFMKAMLREAIFRESDFSESDFSQAVCIRTDFSRADLTGCNFTKALLDGANFEDTDLTNAILNGSHISDDTKISAARGIEKIQCTHIFFQNKRLDEGMAIDCLKNL